MNVNAWLAESRNLLKLSATSLLADGGMGNFARPKVTFVIGNEGADLDSTISSVTLSFHLSSFAEPYIPMMAVRRANYSPLSRAFCELLGIDWSQLIFIDDLEAQPFFATSKAILIDHNDRTGSNLAWWDSGRVTGVLDHHGNLAGDRAAKVDTFYTVEGIASTSTLVAELAMDTMSDLPCREWKARAAATPHAELSPDFKRALLATLIVDAKFFKEEQRGVRWNDRDIRIRNLIEESLGLKKQETNELIKSLHLVLDCQQAEAQNSRTWQELFAADLKIFRYNTGQQLPFASLPVTREKVTGDTFEGFLTTALKLMDANNADGVLAISRTDMGRQLDVLTRPNDRGIRLKEAVLSSVTHRLLGADLYTIENDPVCLTTLKLEPIWSRKLIEPAVRKRLDTA